MSTLQLRLRDQGMLRDVFNEIMEDIWGAMEEYRNTDSIDQLDYVCIHDILLDHLTKSLTGYKPCGERERCHAEITPCILTGPDDSKSLSERSRRNEPYILLFGTDIELDLCLQQIDEAIFDSLCPGNAMRYWISLKPRIQEILRFRLGVHLFANNACGNCRRCTSQKQFDPWRRTEAA